MSYLMNTLGSCCAPLRKSVFSAAILVCGTFTFLVATPKTALAQTTITAVENTTGTSSLWGATTSWIGGVVPVAGDNVVIPVNRDVALDGNVEVSSLQMSGYGLLWLGSHTLTITNSIENNSGVFLSETGTVILNSTVADPSNPSPEQTVRGTTPSYFYNLEVASGSFADFGADPGVGAGTHCFVDNELKLDGGSVVVNPPTYASNSTLVYSDDYTIGTEWIHSVTSTGTNTVGGISYNNEKGIPGNVIVATGATLDFGTSAVSRECTGDLTVNGTGSLDMGTMSNNLTVNGDFEVTGSGGSLDLATATGDVIVNGSCTIGGVASQSVALTMPSAEDMGTLDVKGNLTLGESTANALTITGDEGNISCGGDLAIHSTSSAFGMVEFDSGLAAQTLSGQAITADSLVVDNGLNDNADDSDVTLGVNIDITPGGVFNPIEGSVQINGTFTMNSDANGTARIATLADAGATSDVTGNITFERYVPAVTDGASWLSVGNYVVGATRQDWNDSFGSDFHLVFQWDETHTTDVTDASNGANAWTIISSDAATLEDSDFGYAVYTSANSNPTLTATGTYNTNNITTASLTKSNNPQQGGGWHVLTNPFPCPIDGGQFISENTNFSSYAQYDNNNDNFSTYTSGSASTIDIGQSFWVQVSAAGAVDFNTTQLTHGSNSFIREVDPQEQSFFGLEVAQEDGKFGKTFIQFHEESTPEWEWEMDATHRHSGKSANPEIYTTLENGHKLNINSMGSMEDVESIALVIESGSQGTVYISMDEEYDLPDGICAVFEDLETGEVAALGGEPLVVVLESKTAYENRFVINFMSAPVFEASASHCEGGILHFNGEESELWDVSWEITGGELSGSGCVTGLVAGNYEVEAVDPFSQCEVHSNVTVSEVCMGDFNLNGERDITDLLVLLVGIQPVDNFEGSFPETDCDCDGAMTTLDLLMFLPEFGSGCE